MATHYRSAPAHHKKPASTRARPAPLTKRVSAHGVPKATKSARSKAQDDEDDSMAVSFLQYCATCEKQIIVPSNSILYCSESCRKKDSNKTLPYSYEYSPPQTPFSSFSFDELPPSRDIIPQRSPTTPSKRLSYGCVSEMSDWESTYTTDGRPNQESEAARYLRQFQSAIASTDTTPRARPRYNRSSTSITTLGTAPSLSHTPNSTASVSVPFTPSGRPLPPRHSSSYRASRSVDLVTPFAQVPTTAPSSLKGYSLKSPASCKTSTDISEDELLYEKKALSSASASRGSLKQLFATDAMQAPPIGRETPKRPPWA